MSDWTDNGDGTHSYKDDFFVASIDPNPKRGWDIEGYLDEDADLEYFHFKEVDSVEMAKRAVESFFRIFRGTRRSNLPENRDE